MSKMSIHKAAEQISDLILKNILIVKILIFEIYLRIFTCKIFGRSFEHGFNAFSGVNSSFFSFESFWTILF